MWLWELESHRVKVFNEGGLEDAEGEKVLKSMAPERTKRMAISCYITEEITNFFVQVVAKCVLDKVADILKKSLKY